MTIRIGTSGWSYDHWDGVLYSVTPSVAVRGAGVTIDLDGERLRMSDSGGRCRGSISSPKFGCLKRPVNGEVDLRPRMNVLVVA